MNESSPEKPPDGDSLSTSQPAVGIRLSPDVCSDAVAGAILRAQRHGHGVFVATEGSADSGEAVDFAHQLEAGVIETGAIRSDGECLRDEVARAVRMQGFSGLIWQDDPTIQVDFSRTTDGVRTSSAYVVEAEPKPAVDPEPDVLVAIPALNEESRIADVVRGARRYADDVLVVDDGSEDATAARAADAGATVVEHEANRGYGAALKTAFCEADRSNAENLVIIDGDGQHEPADIPQLLEAQREREADIVIGCRFGEGAKTDIPLYRWVGLSIVTGLTNLSLGVVRPRSLVKDPQSGFRAYNRDAIESIADVEDIGDRMGASTDILHHAHENDFELAEVGATVQYDVENGSNHGPIQHGITLVMNLIQTIERQRPITVLGIPGFVSTFVGIVFGFWTFQNYIHSGTFPIGLALLSSFFALAGIFTAFTAIILHSLSTQLPDK